MSGQLPQRWASFTDGELLVIWEGLTIDDGIGYCVEEDDQPTYLLASEIYAEAKRRGMITEANAVKWEHVV